MTEKTKVIWDEAERKALLEGAVVEKISWDWMALRKDGKRIYVVATCYQCGYGYFVVESSEAPPQRG